MMAVADVFPAEVLLSVVTADGENIFNLAQNKIFFCDEKK